MIEVNPEKRLTVSVPKIKNIHRDRREIVSDVIRKRGVCWNFFVEQEGEMFSPVVSE